MDAYAYSRGYCFLGSTSSILVRARRFYFPTTKFYVFRVRAMGLYYGRNDFVPAYAYASLRGGILIVVEVFQGGGSLGFVFRFLCVLLYLERFFLRRFPRVFVFLFLGRKGAILCYFFIFLVLPMDVCCQLRVTLLFRRLLGVFLVVDGSQLSGLVGRLFGAGRRVIWFVGRVCPPMVSFIPRPPNPAQPSPTLSRCLRVRVSTGRLPRLLPNYVQFRVGTDRPRRSSPIPIS